jgi:hypothetical protein
VAEGVEGVGMHFCVDEIPGFKSPSLPKSVERALRGLLQSDGVVTAEALSGLSPEQEDSNLDVVAETLGHEVIADGSIALQVVIEGLKRRLNSVIEVNEKIRLVGD